MTEPTDAVLLALIEKHLGFKPRRDDTVIDPRTGRFHDVQRYRDMKADILAKWGTPPAVAGEPVVWLVCTEEGDPDMVFFDQLEACQYCEDDDPPKPLYLAAPPTAQAEGWTKLPGQLPEPGMPVLLDIGKKYPIRAMWAAKHTVQAADDDTDWGEYVEEDDMYYAPEGWYEWNQCEDNHWRVTETPRAWMPLPPTSSADSRKGD